MQDLMVLMDRADVIRKFTSAQKQRLASVAVRRVIARDQPLYWQGDRWPNVLLVLSGKLRSVIYSPDGRSYVVSTWETGNEFWAHTLFDGEPMPSTLEAVQESVVYQWEGEDVLSILFDNPDAMRALLHRQTRLIRKRRETIADLAFQPMTARLVKLLLEQVPPSEHTTQRDLTLEQIAAMVASSPEAVCRTLYQLQRDGLLQLTRASITIHDRDGLKRLAGSE